MLRLNDPVNNFSVMSGKSQRFLGLTSIVGSYCVLLRDTTRRRMWGSNPGPLDSESDALTLLHRPPSFKMHMDYIKDQRTNGPVNAHLRSAVYTNVIENSPSIGADEALGPFFFRIINILSIQVFPFK